MPAFRTVSGNRAGPQAVGVLVPPGNRTLMILRPRALHFDLVVVEPPGDRFRELDRVQAGLEAQQLSRALVRWAEGGTGQVEIAALADSSGHWVRVQIETFALLACRRVPGQPYRPHVFATLAEAERTAQQLEAILCPGPDANQELYTNLSQFGRSPASRG